MFCLVVLGCIILSGCGSVDKQSSNIAAPSSSKAWPHPIPCRIQDSSTPDLLVTTLGEVQTSLSQGVFDPAKDQVQLNDGTVKADYYRDVLKISNYSPLDKTHFALPPSGWCTWYFYYSRITEDEVKRNTCWISENLKPYGAQYVQIDDGWQGSAAKEGQRDWSVVRQSQFPNGMAALAGYIKSFGLTPGIWIAPHGQSNPQVVKDNPNVFLLKPDGSSASETWEGKFLVDPTTAESQTYMKALFQKMCDWGYEYFKIDGQPIVVEEYGLKKEFMRKPQDDNVKLYRQTLETMRSVIGKDRYLLGCWGMPVEGIGIMDGSRTAGDIVLGWQGGFMLALQATQRDYYLHNIAWYCDPDVFALRSPLTFPQAQAWATLQGLSGVALMATDRLEDLSAPRVELLRRIYPAVDIRPLDLFRVNRNKTIIDLKVNHLGHQYDVVGLFNYSQEKRQTRYIQWADLGLPADKPIHVYDFWNQDYLGAWEAGMVVNVDPTSCRVLTLLPDSGKIQLISTSRHITQGWVDLEKVAFDEAVGIYSGKSKVVANDPYQLRFVFPKGKNFTIKSTSAKAGFGSQPLEITNHQGWAVVTITSQKSQDIDWTVTFAPAEFYPFPTGNPEHLQVHQTDPNTVYLTWQEQYWLNNGYRVYLNGKLLGYTPQAMFPLTGLKPNEKYAAEVETTWEDATVSKKKSKLEFTLK
jgi:hypothetical protein